MKKYSLRKRILIEMSLVIIVSVIIIGVLVSLVFNNKNLLSDTVFMPLSILLIIMVGVYDIITLRYLTEDIGKIIRINLKSKELHIEKNGIKRTINKEEVFKSYLVESVNNWSKRNIFLNHKYLALLLKSGDLIIITNLIGNPKIILNNLNLDYSLVETFFPNLDYKIGSVFLTENEYEKKVKEFYHNFQNKTFEELTEIYENKENLYTDYAIESAQKLINEKTKNNR